MCDWSGNILDQRDRDRCHPLAHAHDVETTGRKPHFVAVESADSPDDERKEHKTPHTPRVVNSTFTQKETKGDD